MSFVSKEEIFAVTEGMLQAVFQEALGIELQVPFPRLTDKPDLRYDLELVDFAPLARKGDFGIFKQALGDGGAVRALVAPGCAGLSRRRIEELEKAAKVYGAPGPVQ